MSITKRAASRRSPVTRGQNILSEMSIQSEYLDALNFAVWFNKRRCRSDGRIPTEAALKAVEKASRDYILAGQARMLTPRELKAKVLSSGRRARTTRNWTPDAALEQQYSLMAGTSSKIKA